MVGAENLPQPTAAAFKEKYGLDLLEGYGCTEMGPVVALMFWVALALLGRRLSAGFIERRRDNHYAALGLVLFVMAALHNTIDYPLHRPAVVYLFVLLIGVTWAQSWSTAPRRSPA